MKIGIIGAGQIGGTLTRRFRQLGHEVLGSNSRSPETLADLANETGATAVWAKDAAADADLVVVSIPQKNVPDLADEVALLEVVAPEPGERGGGHGDMGVPRGRDDQSVRLYPVEQLSGVRCRRHASSGR